MIRSIALAALLGLLAGPTFLRAQATHPVTHATGDAEAGQAVFQRSCVMCHSLTKDVKIVGPSLFSEMHGPHARTPVAVREIIVHGKGQMPAMSALTDKDIADILAFLRKQ